MTWRRYIVGGALALPLLAGAGAALRIWLPTWVKAKAERAIQARVGLPTSIDGVELGAGSVTLLGVRVGDDQGVHPAWLSVQRLLVQLSPWALLHEGPAGAESVQVEGAVAELRGDHHDYPQWVSSLRPRGAEVSASATPDAKPAQQPAVAVTSLQLSVRDAHGQLLSAKLESATIVRGAVTAQWSNIKLGELPGTRVTIKDADLTADRTEQGLVVREAHVGDSDLVLGSAESPALRGRLRALLPAAPVEPAAAQAPSDVPGWVDTALQHMMEGTVVVIERARVSRADKPVVRDLKARLQMVDSEAVLLEGNGRTVDDGNVEWKLRLWPRALRGEGSVDLERFPLSMITAFLPSLPWTEEARSTVDAQWLLQSDGPTRISWAGRTTLHDVGLYSERIAPEPVTLSSVSLDGRGHFAPAERRLEIVDAHLAVGRATLALAGALEHTPDHYVVDLDLALPRTACDDVLHAIPRALLSDFWSFHLSGNVAGRLRLKADSRQLASTELDIEIQDQCDFVEVPIQADLRRFTGPFLHVAVEPDDTVFEMETGPGTASWTDLDEISPLFVHAVLAHEDTQFFTHPGFSAQHIRGALVRNLEAGRYVLGASTISMQLVKNILLHREKTLARKAQEVILTWWVERMLDKRDILELYLNVIEYGPSIYGIRRAAQYYFSREPSELSPAESVFLSTILPNPKAYHSFFEKNALSASWIERMRSQLQRMQGRGWYARETAQYGIDELAHFRFYPEGSVRMPEPTPMPTKTALLPYQPGALLSTGLPTLDQLNFATIDGGE